MDPVIARKLARTANPYPSVVFLAPEAAAAYAAAGLPRGRTGAGRHTDGILAEPGHDAPMLPA